MPTLATSPLHLLLLPTGRRLDFALAPDCSASVYRRCQHQAWECVAQNARSPFLDQECLPMDAAPEYMVRFRNGKDLSTVSSRVVQAHPMGMPAGPNWVTLH